MGETTKPAHRYRVDAYAEGDHEIRSRGECILQWP